MKNPNFFNRFRQSYKNYVKYFQSEEGKTTFSDEGFFNAKLGIATYYDTLNNDSINKLVKKLFRLPKDKYKIEYPAFSTKKRHQYIQFQNLSHSVGIFANIRFLNDKYFKSINIAWCQRSNYNSMFEFQVLFTSGLDSFADEFEFIKTYISLKSKKNTKYFRQFDIDSPSYKNHKKSIIDYHNYFFKYMVQTVINFDLFTENGMNNDLFSIYSYQMKKIDFDNFEVPYLGILLKSKDKKTLLIGNDLPSTYNSSIMLEAVSQDFLFTPRGLLSWFAQFRNVFYYNIYFDFEIDELNHRISGFSTGSRKFFSSKDLLWIYRKIVELDSSRDSIDFIDADELNRLINEKWEIFYGNIDPDSRQSNPIPSHFTKENVDFLLTKYREQYNFYTVALDSQNTKLNTRIAFISLALSIISIIISMLFSFV